MICHKVLHACVPCVWKIRSCTCSRYASVYGAWSLYRSMLRKGSARANQARKNERENNREMGVLNHIYSGTSKKCYLTKTLIADWIPYHHRGAARILQRIERHKRGSLAYAVYAYVDSWVSCAHILYTLDARALAS